MHRILITGMSGTGKTTVINQLSARGFLAVETDHHDWREWVDDTPFGPGWVWREDRVRKLLATDGSVALFVSGCVSNQGQFYSLFDHIVLFSAPADVIVERLTARTTNTYGKRPEELAEVLENIRVVEPLLRQGATLEIDTRTPLPEVVRILEDLVEG